ncbi:autotransporter-associated beta strand repeat-containing protein [Geofilum rubicundum]|uniref:Outer membrane autotransporter barrel n=1 Tax=Geofilum rubicundum JCM 15548 TaxID=1236989 RepID=A0A0E9LVY0_9BACT|nr:autotransporter-associated beta strand repeat-containing protein [Geofilum rubicundum]GAO29291.1 outer membrane autotransporter barrel [Geofilum rubicundum JCM 15548]
MTDEEALTYTVQDVLGGTDGWDPSAEAPLVTTYTWTGAGANAGWRNPENWDPNGIPGNGEIANADGISTVIDADGDAFLADLNLSNGATLHIAQSSTANYIAGNGGRLTAGSEVALSGQIGTKESNTFDIEGVLTLNATITGVHALIKTGQGSLILAANNTDYSGTVEVQAGVLEASVENALGNGNVTVESGATLVVGHDNAFFPQSVLKVATGAALSLNATVTLSEFYMDNVMQPIGTYDASTHPELISGTGSIVIGRPASFMFLGGNWDVASNYTPALMPEAGETVFCEGEMETTSTIYPADVIFVNGKGRLRMRGAHQSTGSLTFEGGNRLSYATSGTGFALEAPIVAAGDFNFEMSSSQNSSLTLTGTISGSATISVRNTRSSESTTATAILSGDNSGYDGFWDLTTPASNANGVVAVQGTSANAFGSATISVGANNRVIFSHDESTSVDNELILASGAQATLDAHITLGQLTLGETVYNSGTFTSASHGDFFQGAGELKVGSSTRLSSARLNQDLKFYNNTVTTSQAQLGVVQVYALNGHLVMDQRIEGNVLDIQLPLGVYVVKSSTSGLLKISVVK